VQRFLIQSDGSIPDEKIVLSVFESSEQISIKRNPPFRHKSPHFFQILFDGFELFEGVSSMSPHLPSIRPIHSCNCGL
jgi:hypothetical protein